MGGVGGQLRCFFNLALDVLRGQLYTSSALPATKDPLLATKERRGGIQRQSVRLRREGNVLTLVGIQTHTIQSIA